MAGRRLRRRARAAQRRTPGSSGHPAAGGAVRGPRRRRTTLARRGRRSCSDATGGWRDPLGASRAARLARDPEEWARGRDLQAPRAISRELAKDRDDTMTWHAVAKVGVLGPGEVTAVEVAGVRMVLGRDGERYFAT